MDFMESFNDELTKLCGSEKDRAKAYAGGHVKKVTRRVFGIPIQSTTTKAKSIHGEVVRKKNTRKGDKKMMLGPGGRYKK